jgi:nitrate reductase molybdenum cofactor assembly chaperone NarJ/NarW
VPMTSLSETYLLFAQLLEYPTPAIEEQAGRCVELLADACLQAGEMVRKFSDVVASRPIEWLEEIYTSTFDLQGVCYPYIGHHLFGESYKRSWFMARLNEGYLEKGFDVGKELPDHVAVVLRFLALGLGDSFSQVLQDEGLKPAVNKMYQAMGESGENPYRLVIGALLMLLQEQK